MTDSFDLLYIGSTNKQFHTDAKRKGFFSLKKLISVILVLAILSVCCAAFAETEKISFFLPSTVAELGLDELPVNDFPTVKTKKVRQITTITVDGKADKLSANWMGYGETSEEVTLTDGVGQISSEGHKYSVGTHWIKETSYEWLDSYDYYAKDETFAEAQAALKAEHEAAFKTGAGAVIEDSPMEGFSIIHYRNVYYIKNGEYNYIDNSYEVVGGKYATYEEANAVARSMYGDGSISSEYSAKYGATVYTEIGYWIERFGGYADLYKRQYSNGWPNRAYTLNTGEYAVDYTRAGVINYASRTMQNTDLFRTGIEGATSTVNWRVDMKKNQYVPVVTGVSVVYPEGSPVSSISVSYRGNGKIYRYTEKFCAGEDKSYTATYSSKDKLCGATYLVGDAVIAKHSARDKWVNIRTKLFENNLESVDGELFRSIVRVTTK